MSNALFLFVMVAVSGLGAYAALFTTAAYFFLEQMV